MFNCQYCNSERKNKNALVQHEIRCKENPERVKVKPSYGMLGKKGKNQYSYGATCSEETKKKLSEANTNLKHSDETKKKLSIIRKKYLSENPDMVPYKLNHYSKGPSYPEIYWRVILESNGILFEEQYSVSVYSLDFAILDKKIDLEIDGEQHYLDDRVVGSDQRRTSYLEENGWTVLRIRWSDYQKLNRKEKESFVKEIVKQLA